MKQVASYDYLFEIDKQGRRVWLSPPPLLVMEDIRADAARAKVWPDLVQARKKLREGTP